MKRIHANIRDSSLKSKIDCRDKLDILLGRISLLSGKDKIMMTMYYENGNTLNQMAQLTGLSQATICRRIQKFTRRLVDGEYILCIQNRDRFTALEMTLARDYFLKGLSIRQLAAIHHMSYYRTRQILKKIEAILRCLAADKKLSAKR